MLFVELLGVVLLVEFVALVPLVELLLAVEFAVVLGGDPVHW